MWENCVKEGEEYGTTRKGKGERKKERKKEKKKEETQRDVRREEK